MLVEELVEAVVLAAVHGLLADEPGDLPLQVRVVDLVAVAADSADEELLAVGEHRREDGKDVAEEQVVVD